MFQSAFLFSYAKKHGLDYCIPTGVTDPHVRGQGAHRFPGFNYCEQTDITTIFREVGFPYMDLKPMDDVCFHGYWQSWKYFADYRRDLLKALGFDWKMKRDYCSIHVRRGDFLKWSDHHPPVTEAYLRDAIKFVYEKMRGKVTFRFFSDDQEYCRRFGDKIFWFYPGVVEYATGQSEIEDMQDASCCEHNIGSNSSFSWWLHYLNNNSSKIGVFPKQWFGAELPHDTRDLYLPSAIKL